MSRKKEDPRTADARSSYAMPPVIKTHVLSIGRELFLRVLAAGHYASSLRCLAELLRNAISACIGSGKQVYDYSGIRVDVRVVSDWPLAAGKPTLLCFDRGHGFRDEDFERFRSLGPSVQHRANTRGMNQHGIGRFSAFALVDRIRERADAVCVHVMTRATKEGPVRWFVLDSDRLGSSGFDEFRVDDQDPILGPYAGTTGTFSLIVIPECSIYTNELLASDIPMIAPYKDQAGEHSMRITVADAPVALRPLPRHQKSEGPVWICLEILPDGKPESEHLGLEIGDRDHRIPLFSIQRLIGKIPSVWLNRRLRGVAFVVGTLINQDSSRGSFRADYHGTQAWEDVLDAFIELEPWVRELLGEKEGDDGLQSGRDWRDTFEQFTEKFEVVDVMFRPPPRPRKPVVEPRGPNTNPPTTPRDPPRERAIIINEVAYIPVSARFPFDGFAQVLEGFGDAILVGEKSYNLAKLEINPYFVEMSGSRDARQERIRNLVFMAVAEHQKPLDGAERRGLVAKLIGQMSTGRSGAASK